ncbi:hypothetical protein PDESU_04549 [Pontiella desulfatans]|uniref:Lipocalin-like domain-containing protein n=1 Tax=Pontiella desulfatans TaxID=2750659 RepID=A0A6C2U7F6_PONDE|nr:hypothetical protein [Pontiella desulfatans]VGO15960.1 hypothetical protein PDESU_04549 [Pontiella desulfatans]
MKIEWWKLARRGAMAAIIACCVVGLTGCDEDDGEDVSVVGDWNIAGGDDLEAYDKITFYADNTLTMFTDEGDRDGTYEISGSRIVFTFSFQDGPDPVDDLVSVTGTGTVDGDTMSGQFVDSSGDSGDWQGYRL